MSADASLRAAASAMAQRLRIFQGIAQAAQERGSRVDLAPCELWEPADQAALDAYESALTEISGARPLFQETA